jgi:hypothetical protein
MTFLATKAVGGSIGTNYTLNISYNYPEHDWTWLSNEGNPRALRETPIQRLSASSLPKGPRRNNGKSKTVLNKRQNTESDEKNTSYPVVAGSSGR